MDIAGSTGVAAAPPPPASQYLIFSLGGESFGINILHIREIIEFGELTEVPMMPAFVRGVINLRGAVVPIIDLCARFGQGRTESNRRSCFVIVELEDAEADDQGLQEIGVMVDAVNEVVDIAPGDIEPPPGFGAHMRPDFIGGMARHAGQFVILLALDSVLSVDDMSALMAADTTGVPA
ncbi:chemotaxis protein CheW [Viridibacterium curvum]|uniref:Chemotaxis protein CheW n=1 Tax=Viridibacterium curvum TaxID=1101404 RepID=A0ABP9QM43_9RHOO